MEVPPAGIGASSPERLAAATGSPAPANLTAVSSGGDWLARDSVAGLLGELSKSDLKWLLEALDPALSEADGRLAGELLRGAEEAAGAQDPERAMALLRQFAGLNPARAESLPSAAALASIRPFVEQMIGQMTAAARLHAERILAGASQKVGAASLEDTGRVSPEALLTLATRLMEAGGLANYVRSAAVSAAIVDQTLWAPTFHAEQSPCAPQSDRPGLFQLSMAVWCLLGISAGAVCWWVRADSIPAICAAWAGGALLLILARRWPRTRD